MAPRVWVGGVLKDHPVTPPFHQTPRGAHGPLSAFSHPGPEFHLWAGPAVFGGWIPEEECL